MHRSQATIPPQKASPLTTFTSNQNDHELQLHSRICIQQPQALETRQRKTSIPRPCARSRSTVVFYPRIPKAATMNELTHSALQPPRTLDTCTTHGHFTSDSSPSPSKRYSLFSTDEFPAKRKAGGLERIRKNPYSKQRPRRSAFARTDFHDSPATETNDSFATDPHLQQCDLFGPLPECSFPTHHSNSASQDDNHAVPDDNTVLTDMAQLARSPNPLLSPPSSPLLPTIDLDLVPVDDFVLFP